MANRPRPVADETKPVDAGDDVEERMIAARYGNPKRTVGLVLLAAAGGYLMMLTLATALQLRLTSIDEAMATTAYSRIVTVSGIVLLFAVPLVGALSDRTTSRFGRRRPWIIIGYLLTLVCMYGIGVSSSYLTIGICYVVGFLFAQTSFNIFSVIPVEAVPNRLRARVMGFMGMFGALAMPVGAALAGRLVAAPILMMTVPVVAAVVTVIPLLVLFRDPQCGKDEVPPLNVRQLFAGFFVNPRKHPNFGWVWLSRFLAGIAMTSFLSFFVLYLVTNLHYSPGEAGGKAGLLSLYSAPVSILLFTCSGWLSDKLGRRKPFVIGAAIVMATALVIAGMADDFATFTVAWLVFAVGQAMFLTVDLALCAQVLPNEADTGKDMAVFALALNLPTIVVPAVAPAILGASHNYTLLWGIAAVLTLVGAAIIPLVRNVK
ncbi:MFS transporter [Nanchangia anserum]|uniref:MFS transporter n=1 Tax=Nanchangia anserum TaxID=2692125 RepID=A0A8I0GFA9_9ACTO|nr:MFS transporter [Nanchangia anserum]MBD3689787.1 MFS transporter [Nanchangia anserum]QOX81962.1 MFS transporter [Nanchangia anserum]